MSQLTDIKAQIEVETAACVESKKSGSFLGGFFNPRKKFEPGCRLQATAKHQAELTAAENESYSIDYATNTALINQLGGKDTKIYWALGLTFLFIIIIYLLF